MASPSASFIFLHEKNEICLNDGEFGRFAIFCLTSQHPLAIILSAPWTLGNGVTAAPATLTRIVLVQIQVPQPPCLRGLAVRTPPSQGGNTGSNPVGGARKIPEISTISGLFFMLKMTFSPYFYPDWFSAGLILWMKVCILEIESSRIGRSFASIIRLSHICRIRSATVSILHHTRDLHVRVVTSG